MKKHLIALAALAATGAFAQSSVSIYGIVDVAQVYKTHTAADGSTISKTTGIGEGMNAGNRLGFRGTEDLGGGLKANFLVETGMNITNGNLLSTRAAAGGQQVDGIAGSGNMPAGAYSTSTNRQSYVGVSGGFGELRLGYQYNNLYELSTLSGYMNGSEQPGSDIAHLMSNADFGGTRSNGITYISPAFNGFTLRLQHGAGTGRETVEINTGANTANGKTKDDAIRNSLMVTYAQGALKASYAYTTYNAASTTAAGVATTSNNFGITSTTATTAAAADTSAKLHQLGASYDFKVAKLMGTYNVGTRADNLNAALTDERNYQAGQIGVEVPVGKARPFIQVGYGKETSPTATRGDYKTQQFGIRYDLSKRSVAYIMVGTSKDDAAVTTGLAKREITGLGLMHSF